MKTAIGLLMIFLTVPCIQAETIPEEKTKILSQKLRCPVCNGQSLWDSQSPAALDIQKVIFEKFSQDQSEQEIMAYLYNRYGNDILQAPGFQPETYFLWLFPLLLIIGVSIGIFIYVKRRETPPT